MDRRRLIVAAVLAASLPLAGCGLSWQQPDPGAAAHVPPRASPARRYIVRPGDTLYSIAFRFSVDHRQLAAWNNLRNATLIYPGQELRLTPPPGRPASTRPAPSASAPTRTDWHWPTAGQVVSRFSAAGKTTQTGVLISGQRGQPVIAAAAGEVVYSGSGLKGYGKLIIIRHDATYLSAYGHNAALLVAEGDRVVRGQKIATMGETAAKRPRLHFEIRRDGKPVDPVALLPAR